MEEIKIRAKDAMQGGKGIEKLYTEIMDTQRMSSHALTRLQSHCCHQKNGGPSLKRVGTGSNGEPLFKCSRSGKSVKVSSMSVEEVEGFVQNVSDAIDIIKISTNLRNEENIELLKRLAKMQYRLQSVPKQFSAVTKPRKDKKSRNSGGGSVWKG